ncbi:MAG: DUF192 domain-containing protein [Opitutales bacterium]|nr:DUF192 domain-containing protein [Opitutales bacterium]
MYRLKNMFNFLKIALLAICSVAIFTGCDDKNEKQTTIDTLFDLSINNVPFKAQIAVFDSEKMRGLMFRESLPENNGMVFVYDTPTQASFWMKNTLIPLDIGFFDKNGILTEVKKLYPQNLDAVKSSRNDILFCIEMNAGWFDKNNVKSSAKLDMKKLSDAISARKAK